VLYVLRVGTVDQKVHRGRFFNRSDTRGVTFQNKFHICRHRATVGSGLQLEETVGKGVVAPSSPLPERFIDLLHITTECNMGLVSK
jgi:hypothetical protein